MLSSALTNVSDLARTNTKAKLVELKLPRETDAREPVLAEIESLGKHCRDGDVHAWTALFPLIWPPLVTFIHRLYYSLDQEDAEDVAQLSLEAAIRGIGTFDARNSFRAWVFGIAAQQAGTLFRRKSAAKRGLKVVVPMNRSGEEFDEDAKSPVEAAAVKERAAILHRAIEELAEDDRELVQLHFFGELTFKEVGEVRGMNPKTVCTRLTRCKEKLLKILVRSSLTRADG